MPAVSGTLLDHAGWGGTLAYPAVHLLAALGAGLVVALLCCSLFGWLVRFVPVGRLKTVAAVAQVLPLVAFWVYYFARNAPAGQEPGAWPSPQLPAALRAAVEAMPGGLRGTLAAAGMIVAVGAVGFGLRALSSAHLLRIAGLMRSGVRTPRRRRRRLPGAGPWVARLAGGPAARAGYEYVRALLLRDWQFLRNTGMNAAGILAMVLVVPVVGREISPFRPGDDFALAQMLPHAAGFATLFACRFLAFGNDHKGAWTFSAAPEASLRPFAAGVHAALWVVLVAAPSAVASINIRAIGELVSSRESFHAGKEVHRSTHGRGTRGLSTDGPQGQRQPREGASRADSLAGRCGRSGVDRPADRGRRAVPHQDGRECSPAMRAGGVRAGAGTQTARVPAGPEAARRRTGGSHHRPATGAAPEGVLQLVVAAVGAPGRRVGDCRVGQPRDRPQDAKKNGMTRRKIEYWVIPPQADAEFVAHMEQVLDTYAQAYDPACPVVCMDEQPVQLVRETRPPIAATRERPRRVDYEYERAGTASVFLFSEPLAGWRQATARARRTKADWALEVAGLLEGRYADCPQVTLVCDNLNTHTKGAFYAVFEPTRARELVRRIEFCYTPKHGSWLNIAENELSSLTRQCLHGRRIGDLGTLHDEVSAWSTHVNGTQRGVDWQMKVDDARRKLKSVYPKIVM